MENVLKKEFKVRDVQRIRNLITKDYTSKTLQGVGYESIQEDHKEGDVWEQAGKRWTIKNGLKQNVTKLDLAKKAVRTPLSCPKCGGPMNHPLHEKMFKIHGFCFDCTINYEAELRKAGLYSQYEQRMMSGNIKAFSKDLEQWALEFVNIKETFVTENGDIEDWKDTTGEQKKEILNNIKEYSKYLQEVINKE